jgi:hypothetical protein
MSYHNPYWQRVVQNQQKAQSKSQQQRQRRPEQSRDDYGDEWLNKDVEIERVKGQVVEEIRGRVVDISKYWLKLFVNNQVLYLNKAYIITIKPAEIESGASGEANGGREQ